MSVKRVTLDWFRVELPEGELLTSDRAYAETVGEPEPVTVTRYLAGCGEEDCNWEGNPSEEKEGAQGQLNEHVNRAHVIEISDRDGGLVVDEEA